MVILHVLSPADAGGLEQVVRALAKGQRGLGHDSRVVVVLAKGQTACPFIDSVTGDGTPLERIEVPGRGYIQERTKLRSLIDRLRPDLIHTHGYRPDVIDSGVARRMGVPVVTTVHGFTGGSLKNRIFQWLQIRTFSGFDGVIAVSESLRMFLMRVGVPSHKVHHIANAWYPTEGILCRSDARTTLAIPDRVVSIGWVGRLSHEKGPDVLIDAVGYLRDIALTVNVIGDGPERKNLEARAHARAVTSSIKFHGIIPQASRYFAAFDVFALTSRTEGVPIVLFEAVSAGIPVVATKVGGVPEVVTGADAHLVASESPMAVAEGIRDVIERPEDAAIRVQSAKQRVASQYDGAKWLIQYDNLYRKILGIPNISDAP